VTKSRSSRPTSRTRQQQPKDDASDTTDAKPKVNYGKIIGEGALRVLMLVKKATITYSKGAGTLLPGFLPQPTIFGVDLYANQAPGWGFVIGSQEDIRGNAVNGGWITQDPILNNPYKRKMNEAFSYKVNTNILNAIRIDFDGDRVYTERFEAFFRFDTLTQQFEEYTPVFSGNFSISYNIIGTSFSETSTTGESAIFNQFLGDRQAVAFRLANDNPVWKDAGDPVFHDTVTNQQFPVGYGPTSQEVLYFSFLGAYSGKGPEKIDISSPFPSFPIPNWRITFAGLTNIGFIGKAFRTVNITSGYRSMLSLSSWRTNVNFDPDSIVLYETTNNLVQQFDVGMVSLIEAFNPLLGIDLTMHNSLTIRFEYKKSRNLAVSFVNNQMTEILGNEVIIGLGYRIKSLKFTIGSLDGKKKNTSYRSDLNMKLDFGIRDNITTLRRIDENNSQVSAGSKQYTLNFSADYMLSQSLQIRFYYNWISNSPYVSSQFPNATTSAGFSLRFNLAQ
jgi:cell surface protein SprA